MWCPIRSVSHLSELYYHLSLCLHARRYYFLGAEINNEPRVNVDMIHEKIGISKSAASERTEEHEAIEDDRKRTGMIS